ncbi:MAG: sensor histidine kinase [Halanaerobiaceae bacterium]
MKDLSLHLLDLAENSILAGADRIVLRLKEDPASNQLVLVMVDNGQGMEEMELKSAVDPFYTGRNKRVGLGIPLIKHNAELSGGFFEIFSWTGVGTVLTAVFEYNHIDRPPLGDIPETILSLITLNPDQEICFYHSYAGEGYEFKTRRYREELGSIPLDNREVLQFIGDDLKTNFRKLRGEK